MARSLCILVCLLFIVSFLWINLTGCIVHFFLWRPTSSRTLWQSPEVQVQLESTRSVAEYSSVCYVSKRWRGEVMGTFSFKTRQNPWYLAKEGTGTCQMLFTFKPVAVSYLSKLHKSLSPMFWSMMIPSCYQLNSYLLCGNWLPGRNLF